MRTLYTFLAVTLSIQLLVGCSSNSSEDSFVTDEASAAPSTSVPLVDPVDSSEPDTDPASNDPLIDPENTPESSADSCLGPPDFRVGDASTYRYTDDSGSEMDISFSVASTEETAVVFDVTEGASIYQAAISTFCNDTPDFTSDVVSASMQGLIDQFWSRPLLREIALPSAKRFDAVAEYDADTEIINVCAEGELAAPLPDGPLLPGYNCTSTYDPNIAGSTLVVDTAIATYPRSFNDYNLLVEKRQTAADGTTRSLVLVSFVLVD